MADYLNLPTRDNQTRMVEALERIASKETKATDYTNAPGSKVLAAGSRENGFYGFVRPHEFGKISGNPEEQDSMSAGNLALAIGLTQGNSINNETPWMKFSRKGIVYMIPVKPLRRSVSWNAIYKQGAVYGDGSVGTTPPNGRAGKRLSVSSGSNAFKTDNLENGFLKGGAVVGAVGDILVARGFANAANNGEFTISAITDSTITVTGGNLVDEVGTRTARIHEKTQGINQNREVIIGGVRYAVQLMKGASQDPLDSFSNADRNLVGTENEWNQLILPMHERAKMKNWMSPEYAGETEDWGMGLTDTDLVTLSTKGNGSFTWCQETSDVASYHRIVRGYNGASFGNHDYSYSTHQNQGWRPVLRVIE